MYLRSLVWLVLWDFVTLCWLHFNVACALYDYLIYMIYDGCLFTIRVALLWVYVLLGFTGFNFDYCVDVCEYLLWLVWYAYYDVA